MGCVAGKCWENFTFLHLELSRSSQQSKYRSLVGGAKGVPWIGILCAQATYQRTKGKFEIEYSPSHFLSSTPPFRTMVSNCYLSVNQAGLAGLFSHRPFPLIHVLNPLWHNIPQSPNFLGFSHFPFHIFPETGRAYCRWHAALFHNGSFTRYTRSDCATVNVSLTGYFGNRY